MKAEERHELRENDLANWLQYGLWAFLKNNGSYFLLIIALAFLGYQLWNMHLRTVERDRQKAWMGLYQAETDNNPLKSLQDIVDGGTIKSVQAQASLRLAAIYGRIVLFPEDLAERKLSREEALSNAYKYYTKALELEGDDPLIAGNARLGIAGVYEDKEQWDEAKKQYQSMIDDKMFAGGNAPLASLAKERLSTLDDRRKSPRLTAMIPPPAAPKPESSIPGLPRGLVSPSDLGIGTPPASNSAFPGLLLSNPPRPGAATTPSLSPIFGPLPPSPSTAPAPAASLPSIPGIAPTTPATGPN
jgi:hypothetical protein